MTNNYEFESEMEIRELVSGLIIAIEDSIDPLDKVEYAIMMLQNLKNDIIKEG